MCLLKAGLSKRKQKRRTRVDTLADPISRVDMGQNDNTDLHDDAFSKTYLQLMALFLLAFPSQGYLQLV